jgi:hypothetical protein
MRQIARHPLQLRAPSLLIGLLLVAPQALAAMELVKVEYVPFPSKDELRTIQLKAFDCSRENTAESCERTRALADPLMDHPRLPAACKDAIWDLTSGKQRLSTPRQHRQAGPPPHRRLRRSSETQAHGAEAWKPHSQSNVNRWPGSNRPTSSRISCII